MRGAHAASIHDAEPVEVEGVVDSLFASRPSRHAHGVVRYYKSSLTPVTFSSVSTR